MSSVVVVPVVQDSEMDPSRPRSGGPTPRRTYTPGQKLVHANEYESSCERREGGAYLRENGLYSSQMTEWRRLRDAGVLEGKQAGEKIGRLTPEQEEIARLRRALELANRRLARTEVALEIMGKARTLLEELSESVAPQSKAGRS